MQFVEAFDTDNDGVVSKVEWQKGMKMMNLRYHDALEVNIDKLTSRCVRLALARARLLAAMAADGLRGLPQADVRGRENYVWDGCLQLLCVHRPLHRCAQLTGELTKRRLAVLVLVPGAHGAGVRTVRHHQFVCCDQGAQRISNCRARAQQRDRARRLTDCRRSLVRA